MSNRRNTAVRHGRAVSASNQNNQQQIKIHRRKPLLTAVAGVLEQLEQRRMLSAAQTWVNDTWHFHFDDDNSSSLSAGDLVANEDLSIVRRYGLTAFGDVTTGSFSGSLAGASTINDAIANTDVAGTVTIQQGSYAQNVVVNKAVTLDGERVAGNLAVNLTTGADAQPLVQIAGSFSTTDNVSINDINFVGLNGAMRASHGVRVSPTADFDQLTVEDSNIAGMGQMGVYVEGNSTTGVSARGVNLSDMTFTGNGTNGSGGMGDVNLFLYNGDANLTNLDLNGVATSSTGARLALQVRGVGNDTLAGSDFLPAGDINLNNIDISGTYRTNFIAFQRYDDLDNVAFSNVKLGGPGSGVVGTFGAALRFDAVGTSAGKTIDLGNTEFRGLSDYEPTWDIEFAPDNNLPGIRADATGTSWNIGGTQISAGALTLSQLYTVEDRIQHWSDALHPTHLKKFKGFAEVRDGNAYVTATYGSRITHAAEVVDLGGTVNVAAGTYNENVVVDRHVKVIGAGSGSNPASDTVLVQPSGTAVITITGSGASAANPLLIQGLQVQPDGNYPSAGFYIPDGVSVANIKLDDVKAIGSDPTGLAIQEVGFFVEDSADVDGLTIQNSSFDRLTHGLLIEKQGDIAGPTNATNVNISDSSFSFNQTKGIYAEKLSDATFSGLVVQGNGTDLTAQGANTAAGIDINLKGNVNPYSNLVFTNLTVTGNGLLGSLGAGLAIKARGTGSDPSYAANPATLSGVVVTGGTYHGNKTGIRVGEPTRSNTQPNAVSISGVTVNGNADMGMHLTGGQTKVQSSNLSGNPRGVVVDGGAIADLGGGSLGSTGNNNLTGYTGSGTNYAIENLNLAAAADVYAKQNNWGPVANAGVIETVVYDDTDNAAKSEVLFDPPLNVASAAGVVYVNEDWAGTALGADPDPSNTGADAGAANQFGVNAFSSINHAIAAVAPGGQIIVYGGNYDEAVVITKPVHLKAAADTQFAEAVTTLTRTSGTNAAVVEVRSDNVTIEGFNIVINRPNSTIGIGASNTASGSFVGGTFNNLTIKGNTITSSGTGGTTSQPFLSTDAAGIMLLGNGTPIENVTIENNTVNVTTSGTEFRRRAVFLREVQATVTANDLKGQANDLIVQFSSSNTGTGKTIIGGNTFRSGGLDITEPNSTSGGIEITDNTFTFTTPTSGQALLLKNVDVATLVQGNSFTGHGLDIAMGLSSSITIDDNTFTSGNFAGATHILMDTGLFPAGGGIGGPHTPVTATITNNTFNGHASTPATAIALYNTQPALASPNYSSIVVGTNGNENTFKKELGKFISLDYGTPAGSAAVIVDIDASQNVFETSTQSAEPSGLSLASLFEVEDKIQHEIDHASLGLVRVKAGELYLTTNSFTAASSPASVQRAINAATAGDTIHVNSGTYVQSAQVVVNKDVEIIGQGMGSTIFESNFDTASAGDGRGWWLVQSGKSLDVSKVTFDGNGKKVWQAIRNLGGGSADQVEFTDIKFDPSGPNYAGTAVAAFGTGTFNVTNSVFTQIGRVGVLYFGAAVSGSVYADNTYTGKGAGNWLDYAVEVSNGAQVDINDNTISNNLGIASVDSSESAAVLVTTFFGAGTAADLSGNDISNNRIGVAIGAGASDSSTVTLSGDDLTGNNRGIVITGATASVSATGVDISNNATAGVDVNGSNATLTNATIDDNGVGVDVSGVSSLDLIGGSVTDNDINGVFVDGNNTDTQDIHIDGTTFSGNSANGPVSAGQGEISLYRFAAASASTAVIKNVNITSNNPDYAIQVFGANGPLLNQNAGRTANVTLDNVNFGGTQQRFALYIQQYANLSTFSFTDVEFNSTAAGGLVMFDTAGTLNLGNTIFRDGYTDANGVSGTGLDIVTSLTNVDATGVAFYEGATAIDKSTLAGNFKIEDRVAHAIDAEAPLPAVAGLITWHNSGPWNNALFVTTKSFAAPFTTSANIQRGVKAASADDTIYVQAGTYANNVVLNKDVDIVGEGSGVGGTIIDANGGVGIDLAASGSAGDAISIEGVRVIDASDAIRANAAVSYVDLANVHVGGSTHGLGVTAAGELSNINISDSAFDGNDYGFYVASTGSVTDLLIDDSSFTGNDYGLYNEATSSITNNQLDFADVTISDTTFNGNTVKSIYVEKADDFTLSNVDVTANSADNLVDLNLKHGAYTDFQILNGSSFTNTGTGTTVHIKGRNDGVYASNPASVAGVMVSNSDFTSSATSPTVFGSGISVGNNVTGLSFSDANFHGTGNGILLYTTAPQSFDLADSAFDASLGNYIINTTTGAVNATASTFGGATATLATGFAIADKIVDGVDVGGLGLVRILANNVFVTVNSFTTALGTTQASVQRGVNVATAGDTINIGAGTFNGAVNVDRRVTINGSGAGTTTLNAGAAAVGVTIAASGLDASNQLVITDLTVTNAVAGFSDTGGQRSFIKLEDVEATGNSAYGFHVINISNLVLDDVSFSGNTTAGLRMGTAAHLDNLTITDGHFDNNQFGIVVFATNSSTANENDLTNVTITGSTFNNNTFKGLYFEKLDNADIDGITMNNSGTASTQQAAAIDINLKYGNYENITIRNSTITNSGTGDVVNGAAIMIKARNDATSYNINFATLNNVSIRNNFIDSNQAGIRFGEPGKLNAGPTNAVVFENHISGNTLYGLNNQSLATIDAESNFWGTQHGPTTPLNVWAGTPKGDAVVIGAGAGSVDFTPWLTDGTDTSAARGFQPNAADVTPPATPPAPNLDAASDSGTSNTDDYTADNTPTFTGTAEANGTVEIFDGLVSLGTAVVNGSGDWVFTVPALGALGNGVHSITVKATDGSGNTSAASAALTITVDTISPAAPVIDLVTASDTGSSTTDNITSDNTPSFSGTAEADAIVNIYRDNVLVGSTTADGSGVWNFTSAALADGDYDFAAIAKDAAGNTSTSSNIEVVIVDTTVAAPSAPDLDPLSDSGSSSNDNITSDNTPKFTGTAEANSTVEIFADGNSLGITTTNGLGAWSFTSPALADGDYDITAVAKDVAGNVSLASAITTVTIDTAVNAPSTPDLAAGSDTGSSSIDNETADATPEFTGTAEANSTVEIFDGLVSLGTTVTDGSGNWSFTVASALGNGSHSISAVATDVAGNVSAASSALLITIDTVAPAAPSVDLDSASDTGSSSTDNNTADNTPTFNGSAEADSTVKVYANNGGGPVLIGTATATGGTWTFTVGAGNELPDGTYTITATATDAGGNTSVASSPLVVVIDTTAPAAPTALDLDSASDSGASNGDNITNDTTPIISGLAEADSTVEIFDGATSVGTATANGSGVWTFTFGALANGSHTITAKATDAAGNTSLASSPLVLKIDAATPVANANGPYAVNEGSPITLTGTYTDATEFGAPAFLWELISATTGQVVANGTSQNFGFTPTDNGSYVFRFTVTDLAGNSHSNNATVTVNNVAPTLTLSGAANVNEGSAYSLTLGASDPGTDTISSWTVNWGDGNIVAYTAAQVASGSGVVTHTYADGNNGYVISATATDEDGTHAAGNTVSVTVANVAPQVLLSTTTPVINEGQTYSLKIEGITDPGTDTITTYVVFWGDGTSSVYTAAQVATAGGVLTHLYDDDAAITSAIKLDVVDEDGGHSDVGKAAGNVPVARAVNNVAPTAVVLNGGAVNEGSNGLVTVVSPSDPSAADSLAGYTYSYDFNNDGDFTDAGEIPSTTSTDGQTVPGSYLSDNPSRTIRVVIRDKDGGETALFTTITINNVAPTFEAGANGSVTVGGTFTRTINFTDPGADSWDVTIDYGDGSTPVTFTTTNHTFNLNHTYTMTHPGRTVSVAIDDGDGGVATDSFLVAVTANTFRVNTFTANASGFDITFTGGTPDLGDLNLYDGNDAAVEVPDVVVTGPGGTVLGSWVWNSGTGTATFVATGGVLAPGNYTVTLRSDATDGFNSAGSALDGDSNFTAGGNYVQNFTIGGSLTDRVVSMRDFARGKGQNVNVPATGSKLPITISNPSGVTAVDFELKYDPSLLDITAIAINPALSGWTLTTNPLSGPFSGTILITLSGAGALAGTSPLDLLYITASVPNGAPYGAAQVIRINNLQVFTGATQVASKGDFAVHKAAYLGDTNGNGIITGDDVSRVSRLAVDLDTGLDAYDLTDPRILADIDNDADITGGDAGLVASETLAPLGPPFGAAEIPDVPNPFLTQTFIGPDPTISIPLNIQGYTGGTVLVPVGLLVESGANLSGFTTFIEYDTTQLDLTAADITLDTSVFTGWTLTKGVNEANGLIGLTFHRNDAVTNISGTVVNMNFSVKPTAATGVVSLDVSGAMNDGGLTYTHVDGSIDVFAFAVKNGSTLDVYFDGTNVPIALDADGANATATRDGVTLNFAGITSVVVHGSTAGDTLNYAGLILPLDFQGGTGSDVLNVNGGTLTAAGDLGAATSSLTVNVGATAAVVFDATQHLAGLSIVDGVVTLSANGTRLINTGSVTLAGAGKLDLKDNGLLVRGGDVGTWTGSGYTGVQGMVAAGRNGGTWNGAGIVTSAILGVNDYTTLAVASGADLGLGTTTWRGESVDSGDVLVMFTYAGDAQLDGKINIDDYGVIDFNVGSSGSIFGYANGDFNYDGKINIDDYGIIDYNVSAQGPTFPTASAAVAESRTASAEMTATTSSIESAALAQVTTTTTTTSDVKSKPAKSNGVQLAGKVSPFSSKQITKNSLRDLISSDQGVL